VGDEAYNRASIFVRAKPDTVDTFLMNGRIGQKINFTGATATLIGLTIYPIIRCFKAPANFQLVNCG
jgi:hypothetical protein